jgi:biofilm PGA synthesis N-glycosyltransferase PgaC
MSAKSIASRRRAQNRGTTAPGKTAATQPQPDGFASDGAPVDVLECSVGVMAYNEQTNIGQLLNALAHQQTNRCVIREIIVLASGCTDGTEGVVRDCARRYPNIKLITQPRREGKASAVNLFLRHSIAEILVLVGADTLPTPVTIERLVEPLHQTDVGMTGGHPMPVNDPSEFMGFAAHFLWELHHQVALRHPKLGELTAFRRVFFRIPFDSATDEANIEPLIQGQAYELRYVPDSVVYNRGPATVQDYLRQRRRIHAGHLRIYRKQRYAVSTLSIPNILDALFRSWHWDWKHIPWIMAIIGLEAYARLLGWIDYKFRNQGLHVVWAVAATTKEAIR